MDERKPIPMLPPDGSLEEHLAVFPGEIFEGFTPREQQAILYYLQCGNKTAAYMAAGFQGESETRHKSGQKRGAPNLITDNKHASRFFARTRIAEAVARAQAVLTARAGVLTEDILAGLKTDAYGDAGDLYIPGTFQLKPLSEWPEVLRRSVQEVTTRALPNGDIITTVKFPDRIKAKELLGKHKRLWEEKAQQGQGSTLIIQQLVSQGAQPSATALPLASVDAGSFLIRRAPRVLPPEDGEAL